MPTIRHGAEKFRLEPQTDAKPAPDFLSRKMAAQIGKYGDQLFAASIKVDAPNGLVAIYPQRTNEHA